MNWLRIPRWLLDGFIENMPKLAAESSMRRASETAVGTGNMKKQDSENLQRRWARDASSARAVPVRTAVDLERMAADLGIQIEKVPSVR